jgi:hypothetical protein
MDIDNFWGLDDSHLNFSLLRLVLKPVTVNLHVRLPMFVADSSNSSSNFIFAHVWPDSE